MSRGRMSKHKYTTFTIFLQFYNSPPGYELMTILVFPVHATMAMSGLIIVEVNFTVTITKRSLEQKIGNKTLENIEKSM